MSFCSNRSAIACSISLGSLDTIGRYREADICGWGFIGSCHNVFEGRLGPGIVDLTHLVGDRLAERGVFAKQCSTDSSADFSKKAEI